MRHTERHLHTRPAERARSWTRSRATCGAIIAAAAPPEVRERVGGAVAVAGTATQCAAIDLGLEPYDAARVEGHVLSRGRLREIRASLSALPLAERRKVPGLDPDRAPTIVAGTILLAEVMDAFGLEACEVSERDILWGAALDTAPDF